MMRLWQCVGWAFLLCGVARAAKFTPLETRTNDTIFFSYAQSPDGRWIAGGSQARKDATRTNLPPSGCLLTTSDAPDEKRRCGHRGRG